MRTTEPALGQDNLAREVAYAMDENELAFETASQSRSLVFDLRIESEPQGAKIAFKRRGDLTYEQNPDATNAIIDSLPLAIWRIKVSMAGFEESEIIHDPFRQKDHTIRVSLHRK